MHTTEMAIEFIKKYNIDPGYEQVIDNMICIEAEDNIRTGRYKGEKNQWGKATAGAYQAMQQWFETAHEYKIKSIADFVATHRRACAVTVLLARELADKRNR